MVPTTEDVIAFFILLVSVPLFFAFLFTEVQDNPQRKGLRYPITAISIGIFLLYFSESFSDPFTLFFDPLSLFWNPFFVLGFGFAGIGGIALYKKHRNGLVSKY